MIELIFTISSTIKYWNNIIDFLEPSYHIDIHTYEWLSNYKKGKENQFLSTPESIGIQVYSQNKNILFHKIKQVIEQVGF